MPGKLLCPLLAVMEVMAFKFTLPLCLALLKVLVFLLDLTVCKDRPLHHDRPAEPPARLLQVMYEYDEPDFALIDTLFSLAEAYLFMQLVEMHDTNPGLMPGPKTNADLYRFASAVCLVDSARSRSHACLQRATCCSVPCHL